MNTTDPLLWIQLQEQIVECERCPRLRAYCAEIARVKRAAYRDWEYWGKPVPNFGDPNGRLMLVGLAPGAHGSNRTGRMFTGDRSGVFLFRALHETGFANQPEGDRPDDGLRLHDLCITATNHCAPPNNMPNPDEIVNCSEYLVRTFALMQNLQGVIALGKIGFDSVVRFYLEQGWIETKRGLKFAHGALYTFEHAPFILCTYHPSQQNTFTGLLTMDMFLAIFRKAREMLR
ncbi:MAG: uracil-DNA glycosylase [Candidatus Kapaibacterium sp.]